jgi:hypothetical protein
MPRPRDERQAWKDELAELPALIAGQQSELDATHVEDKETRDHLRWRIRRAQLRMVELEKRLAGGPDEGGTTP